VVGVLETVKFVDRICKYLAPTMYEFTLFTQPPMRRMRICFTDVFLFFFSFATKIPDNRSRERLNEFS